MSIYSLFAIHAAVIYSILAIIVYSINRKEALNRIFIFTVIFGAYVAFTTFMSIQADSPETAYFWSKIGFLWPFFIALLFQFIMVFTSNRFARTKLRIFTLYLPAALFSILDLTTNQISGAPVSTVWGYLFAGSDSALQIASNFWLATLSFISVLICLRYYIVTNDENKKQQAKLITIGIAYPIAANLLSVAAYLLFGWDFPYTGVGANAVLCFLVFLAIWKYGLFNLNPSIAAENIIATMPDSFILTDLKGNIIRTNRALTNLIGFKEKELMGKNLSHLLTNTTTLADLSILKEEILNYETQITTQQNMQKTVSISASLIKNKKGKSIGVTLIIHDLTRQRLMEEKMKKNERFAAIGELAGMVGHDLRNPLTSIQGATYYLKVKNKTVLNEPSKQMLETIEKSISYSNKIINDLLDYSGEIKLKLEQATPKSLTANALELSNVPKNIELNNQTIDSPTLQVDIVKLTRVFVNIIKNACEAMPNGGTLTIKSTQALGNVEFQFEDSGLGMTQETIDKLWTPLFTTKAKGMGFGLPICKRIIEAHGGKIQVQTALNEGTIFTIIIPSKPNTNSE